MTSSSARARHLAWLRALASDNPLPLQAWFSADHRLRSGMLPPALPPGPRGVREALARLRRIFHPWHCHVTNQVGDDTQLATQFVAVTRHVGALGAFAATGETLIMTGIMMSRFAHGLAYDTWVEVNAYDALRRAGAVQAAEGAIMEEEVRHAETGPDA